MKKKKLIIIVVLILCVIFYIFVAKVYGPRIKGNDVVPVTTPTPVVTPEITSEPEQTETAVTITEVVPEEITDIEDDFDGKAITQITEYLLGYGLSRDISLKEANDFGTDKQYVYKIANSNCEAYVYDINGEPELDTVSSPRGSILPKLFYDGELPSADVELAMESFLEEEGWYDVCIVTKSGNEWTITAIATNDAIVYSE